MYVIIVIYTNTTEILSVETAHTLPWQWSGEGVKHMATTMIAQGGYQAHAHFVYRVL